MVEALTDLLRDPVYQVRLAAVRGLGAMRAVEAIPALETFMSAHVLQDAAVAERVLDDLRSTDKVDGSAQQKQIETLSDRVRKLEDEVQRITG